MKDARGATLARWLLWSHGVIAAILISAVVITLWGLVSMNAAIAEIKNQYLADFEEEEQMHRAAWAIETEARHGALSCERSEGAGAAVAARIAAASRQLAGMLQRHVHQVSPAMARAALGYQRYGERVSGGDVCAGLRDANLGRQRLELDEELTDSWILKLKELRLAITQRELAAQRLGSVATLAGLGFGVLALVAAVLTARSVARSVTVPLAGIAVHARQLGEGDFSPLPRLGHAPFEVSQLATELDRMRVRLSEVSQLKQAFLDSVSHDLRTPLAHIREALSLLLDGSLGPLHGTQHRVAQLALRACEREIRLVSALLDLSRLRSGQPLRFEPGQRIDPVIHDAVDSAQELATRAGVELRWSADEPVPALRMDAMLIETALSNVIVNAITASPAGSTVTIERACVRAALAPGRASAEWLQVVVRDRGTGIEPALRERIFDPFFTTKLGSDSHGSGLGLPLAREMLRAHQGDLTLLSEASDQGTAFALWLPLEGSVSQPAHSLSPRGEDRLARSHA